MEIKNIILDLGGVLYDLDYQKTQKAFDDLGYDEMFSKKSQSALFDDFEEGIISGEEFLRELADAPGLVRKPSKAELISAWNAMLLGMKADKFQLLYELKEKYRLFLFSNTNEIHIKAVWEHLQVQHGIANLNSFFEVVYLSNELGMRKPRPDSFLFIVKENNLIPSQTLFVDDSPQHVEGAKKAGIHALWLDLELHDLRTLLQKNKLH